MLLCPCHLHFLLGKGGMKKRADMPGGALGTILGAYLARSRPQLHFTVKVFGTPRMGNSKWADYVEASVSRERAWRGK